jgi:hypothetical protein
LAKAFVLRYRRTNGVNDTFYEGINLGHQKSATMNPAETFCGKSPREEVMKAMKDLRDFIATCEKEGELHRIKAEVDWDLELSHICKVVEEKAGPAVLFENIKGYKSPVLTGAFATTKRLAIILGKGTNLSMVELTKEWVAAATKEVIPAKEVKDGPIFENILEGDKVDTFAFPSPKFYELDGGRYFGTAVFMSIQDPDTGDVNLGTYRMGVLDSKTVGVQLLKGKKGDRILKKYGKKGKKMPACAIIGGDPLHIFASSAAFLFRLLQRSCWKGRSMPSILERKGPSENIRATTRKNSSSPFPNLPWTSSGSITETTPSSGKRAWAGRWGISTCCMPLCGMPACGPSSRT